MRTLVIMPIGIVPEKPYRLVLRAHDLSGADYETVAHLTEETARNKRLFNADADDPTDNSSAT